MKRIWCIILGLIPVINFGLQYYFCKQEKILDVFKKHRTCYRLDWIFIPLNILFCFLIISVSRKIILLIGVTSLIINYVIHHLRSLDKNIENSHLVHTYITKAGRIHMVFSSIEVFIITLIFLSPSQGIVMYSELGLLVVFIIGLIYGAYRIHHKIYRSDIITVTLLGIAIITKAIYLK